MGKISLNNSVYTLASASGRVSIIGDAINLGVIDFFLIIKLGFMKYDKSLGSLFR
jgi:tRNA(Phe) wybutosine-synthesizing methylase Tyw3